MDNSNTATLAEPTHAHDQHRMFEALRNGRRRFVLLYLYQSPQQSVPMSELIDELAACKESEGIDPDHRTAVYVSMHQNHLPRMKQFELIEHNQNTGLITLTDAGNVCVRYLHPFFTRVSPWSRLFRLLTVVAVVLFVFAVGNVPVSGPALSTMTSLVTATFLVVSIGYYLGARRVTVNPCRVTGGQKEQLRLSATND